MATKPQTNIPKKGQHAHRDHPYTDKVQPRLKMYFNKAHYPDHHQRKHLIINIFCTLCLNSKKYA